MCTDRIIRRVAGAFVLASAWLLFTAFVGINLLQSSFTGFCPLEKIFGYCGVAGCACRSTPVA